MLNKDAAANHDDYWKKAVKHQKTNKKKGTVRVFPSSPLKEGN